MSETARGRKEERQGREGRRDTELSRGESKPVESAVVLVAADTAHCFCWPKYICPLEGPADAGAV